MTRKYKNFILISIILTILLSFYHIVYGEKLYTESYLDFLLDYESRLSEYTITDEKDPDYSVYESVFLLDFNEDSPILLLQYERFDDKDKTVDFYFYEPKDSEVKELKLDIDIQGDISFYKGDNELLILDSYNYGKDQTIYSLIKDGDIIEGIRDINLEDSYNNNQGKLIGYELLTKDLYIGNYSDPIYFERNNSLENLVVSFYHLDKSFLEDYIRSFDFNRIFIEADKNFTIAIGEKKRLNLPSNVKGVNYKFNIINPDIISIDENANILGITEGETDLLVRAEKPGYRSDSVKIKVKVVNNQEEKKDLNFKLFSIPAFAALFFAIGFITRRNKNR